MTFFYDFANTSFLILRSFNRPLFQRKQENVKDIDEQMIDFVRHSMIVDFFELFDHLFNRDFKKIVFRYNGCFLSGDVEKKFEKEILPQNESRRKLSIFTIFVYFARWPWDGEEAAILLGEE